MAIQGFTNSYYSENGLQKGRISATVFPESAHQPAGWQEKYFSYGGVQYVIHCAAVFNAVGVFPISLPIKGQVPFDSVMFDIPFPFKDGGRFRFTAGFLNQYQNFVSLKLGDSDVTIFNFADTSLYNDGNSYIGLCVTLVNGKWGIGFGSQRSINSGLQANLYSLDDLLDFGLTAIKYSDSFGAASNEEGYEGGTFDNESDVATLPPVPTYGVSSAGFVNVYRTSINALKEIGKDLFPTPADIIEPPAMGEGTLADIVNAVNAVTKTLGNLFLANASSMLTNYIIDCHLLPVNPNTGDAENIKIGYKQSAALGSLVTSDYIDFDCGSLNVGEYFANFMDYVGTTIKLYLPFIGFVPIKNEYVQGATLSIKYRFNVIDGSFMCFILSTPKRGNMKDSVIATYSGNCCVHIPITGLNYASMVSGVVANVGAGASALAGGNVAGAFTGAMNAVASRPDIQQSNGYNSTSAYLGGRTPYILFSRQIPSFSETYNKEKGLPLNVTKKIGDLTGFTKIDSIILDGLSIYEDEKDELLNMLREGVIL